MPQKASKTEKRSLDKTPKVEKMTPEKPSTSGASIDEDIGDDDEWEEVTMAVTVNGILDAETARVAIRDKQAVLRFAETDSPILQLNNAVYTASWCEAVGTNLILQLKSGANEKFEVLSCTSTMLQAEKALLTSTETAGADETDSAALGNVVGQ
ncbi:unnamed protein product [Caenorhabditis bovis]|uniref:Transcription factor TFIIIC triple barrel domain-containing protein n=1 Tax=Caenorhabditis bovis TaxID=2654633 RepID=A0A8S1F7B9_9PELO|nr:unnamed protein product [Caenorhabditis bovis]